jgi:hypothetical protein
MGAAFFSPGTIRIRDSLQYAFGPANIGANARTYSRLFDPANNATLADIANTPYMDLPPHNDPDWGSKLHGRFQGFLTSLYRADPTTHTSIKAAMHDALTASPPLPMKFHVAHQNAGYRFVHWTEEDATGLTWLNCLLFCPALSGPTAKRLRRVIGRRQARKTRRTKKKKQ